ncbi:hypothetical protein PMAYCL1PPCAC_29201 [Pristionchus mayeri]|uniref:C2H2-type domain-containing protein n=1 Tax=Pristionchus mayeri TaxID=1317129 RepID=A0AAN5D9N1_9BILA|nr:hypothetical protein PMAYCL1PPCAC_29201 [Pristionchus mayeri]
MSELLVPDQDEEEVVEDSYDSVPGSSSQVHKCRWCPKIFSDGPSLKSHLASYHSTHPAEHHSTKKEGSGRLLCAKRDCGMALVSYEALGRHCADEHGFVPHYENVRFEDMDHFKEWLMSLASISGDMVKRRGERKSADGITMGDYHCVFDGKKRETPSTRAADRAPYNRRVPSKKLGFACPAFIRYQVHLDETVTIKSQLQHFGHDIKPMDIGQMSKSGSRGRNMGRSKERRRGYTFDGLNYEEMDSHPLIDEEGIEIDSHGMVNLNSFPPLERARYRANSSCASMDIALLELEAIPHENLQGVGHLIEKLHEISEAANIIESIVKELASPPNHSLLIEEDSTKRCVMNKQPSLQLNRKLPLPVMMKEENDDKHSTLEENGAHEDESFEQQSESGQVEYEGESVAEEVVVDDHHHYIEERQEDAIYAKIVKRRNIL